MLAVCFFANFLYNKYCYIILKIFVFIILSKISLKLIKIKELTEKTNQFNEIKKLLLYTKLTFSKSLIDDNGKQKSLIIS